MCNKNTTFHPVKDQKRLHYKTQKLHLFTWCVFFFSCFQQLEKSKYMYMNIFWKSWHNINCEAFAKRHAGFIKPQVMQHLRPTKEAFRVATSDSDSGSDDNHSQTHTDTHTDSDRPTVHPRPPGSTTQRTWLPRSSRKCTTEYPERSGIGTKFVQAGRVVRGPVPTPAWFFQRVLYEHKTRQTLFKGRHMH